MAKGSHALVSTIGIVIWNSFPTFCINVWFCIYKMYTPIKRVHKFVLCWNQKEYWRYIFSTNFSEIPSHLNSVKLRYHSIMTSFIIFRRLLCKNLFVNFTNHFKSSVYVCKFKSKWSSTLIKWYIFNFNFGFSFDVPEVVNEFLPVFHIYSVWQIWKDWRRVFCTYFKCVQVLIWQFTDYHDFLSFCFWNQTFHIWLYFN